jgi:transposase
MAGFVAGVDRGQATLLPECLEDRVDETNPIRVIDAFVDALDLRKLGFEGMDPADIGRPAYHPSVHLKLYIYGYLNRVQSSRRLEREASRNVEVMWLVGRLAPDHKTIADFRKDNGPAIKKVCARFVELCRKMGLVKASVAIDGSKFKAVNNRDKNFTKAKVERRRTRLEQSVGRYLAQLDTADRQEASETIELNKTRLKEKLTKLKSEMAKLEAIEKQVLAAPDQQISLTDSRSMATSGRGSGVVDTKNHLIVAHEVSNVGSDRSQLANTAKAAKEAIGTETLEAIADRGYFNGDEIKTCDDAGITVTLPKPMTSWAKANGRFGKEDFVYLAAENVYRCPAGEKLTYRFTSEEKRAEAAPLLDQCLPELRAQEPLHAKPAAAHQALGA